MTRSRIWNIFILYKCVKTSRSRCILKLFFQFGEILPEPQAPRRCLESAIRLTDSLSAD